MTINSSSSERNNSPAPRSPHRGGGRGFGGRNSHSSGRGRFFAPQVAMPVPAQRGVVYSRSVRNRETGGTNPIFYAPVVPHGVPHDVSRGIRQLAPPQFGDEVTAILTGAFEVAGIGCIPVAFDATITPSPACTPVAVTTALTHFGFNALPQIMEGVVQTCADHPGERLAVLRSAVGTAIRVIQQTNLGGNRDVNAVVSETVHYAMMSVMSSDFSVWPTFVRGIDDSSDSEG